MLSKMIDCLIPLPSAHFNASSEKEKVMTVTLPKIYDLL